MSDSAIALTNDPEQPDNQDQEQPEAKPDYGDWNENLPENLQQALLKLDEHYTNEFRYARRLEVMASWRARSFWREMQHLYWNWDSQWWDTIGPAGYSPDGTGAGNNRAKDSAVLYATNIFQGFGDAFIAIITQAVPALRFEPEDPNDEADIEAARAAEPMRKIIQHDNDPVALMTKAAYYAWCDGRMHGWTRLEVDKRTKKPKVKQSLFGSMEVKVPVIYDCEDSYPYLQYGEEVHLSTARDKVRKRAFPSDYYKKIQGGGKGSGQDIYERTARISVKQGISLQSAGGDAYSHLVTTKRTWLRPSTFFEDPVEESLRNQLSGLFPDGCYLESDNGVYTGSRNANMDDEWAVENIMEGDGSFRNGKGTCLISVQERVNDTINMTQDAFEKGQPATHYDSKLFDVDGMRRQQSTPAAKYPVNIEGSLQPGDTVAAHVFEEKAAVVDASQLTYLEKLMTDVPEFLTGISAILFGSDSSGDKSGKALQVQQSAAMGRVGLSFRVMKRLYACMMEQAIRCASRNANILGGANGLMAIGVPDANGNIETVAVRLEQLVGSVHVYADSDENYPETWVQKRATYMQLLADGNSDPVMRSILSHPKNQEMAKKLIGLTEFEIPGSDSWNKQMAEIQLMLDEDPVPGQLAQVPNPLTGDLETIQTPDQPSVPIDPNWDDHAAEFQTVMGWINSPDGQKMKRDKPEGFKNVQLHGMMHKQAMAQAAMAQAAQAQPPAPAAPAKPAKGPDIHIHAAPEGGPKEGQQPPAAGM